MMLLVDNYYIYFLLMGEHMEKSQKKLITEEQRILNKLIDDMDIALLKLEDQLTQSTLKKKKAKEGVDAYGALVSAEHARHETLSNIKSLELTRDSLYNTRIEVEISRDGKTRKDEIKIGLHSYIHEARFFVVSWKRPVCRHYLLDNSSVDYDNVVTDKHGEKYVTHYKLELKRKIEMSFDKVKHVTHFFPLEETEKIIADEFLKELLLRRSEKEFKNIVFSIQKRQGEIIQTPYNKNLIIQGCAGSGKSMIMLHRLPILLFDNPNILERKNMYIVSPSKTYIQMAENMRTDLEIEDLNMGTLNDYYDHLIKKYNVSPNDYGIIDENNCVNGDYEYIYSSKCVEEIEREIKRAIEYGKMDYTYVCDVLGIDISSRNIAHNKTFYNEIQKEILIIQELINNNDNILKVNYNVIRKISAEIDDLCRSLELFKDAIIRDINKKLEKEEQELATNIKELRKIDPAKHEIMYKNRVAIIESLQKNFNNLNELKQVVADEASFFEDLQFISSKIRKSFALFENIEERREIVDINEQYRIIRNKSLLISICQQTLDDLNINNPFEEYQEYYKVHMKRITTLLDSLRGTKDGFLTEEYLGELMKTKNYYAELDKNVINNVYKKWMKKLGCVGEVDGKIKAATFSPYLYLQILYTYRGIPNTEKETLITVDEAQNLAPEELKLIKKINGNDVIFNLFGDVMQHVEGDKGVDSWNEFDDIESFQIEEINDNYRNARQITQYCNNKFNMNMRAINLDGAGVHECIDYNTFKSEVKDITNRYGNNGIKCILMKNKTECGKIINELHDVKNYLNDMSSNINTLSDTKWNIMTISQAKGLEFETVIAFTSRMTQNEKYIAYTRALNELYIYDIEI